jgi:hypothetical protein
MPLAEEARTRAEALRKATQPLKLKLAYAGGRPIAPPAPAAQPLGKLRDPEMAKAWERKLRERVQAVLKAGGKVRCEFRALGTRISLLALDERGGIRALLDQGGQLDLKWSQLQASDLRSLAVELANTQDTPSDHALAAFYLLYLNEGEKAAAYLQRAEGGAAAVREAFAAP